MKLLAVLLFAEIAVLLAGARIAWVITRPDPVAAEAECGTAQLEVYLREMASRD